MPPQRPRKKMSQGQTGISAKKFLLVASHNECYYKFQETPIFSISYFMAQGRIQNLNKYRLISNYMLTNPSLKDITRCVAIEIHCQRVNVPTEIKIFYSIWLPRD